jgi:hypothetical protein
MKTLTLLMMTSMMIAPLMILGALPAFAGTHKIVYEIPAPPELEPFSRFDLTYESVKDERGQTEVVYKLPKLLLGQETEFRFQGQVDFSKEAFSLRAKNAEMSCSTFPSHALCRVKYRKVKVDLEGVRAELESLPISQTERNGRFQLASMIAKDGGDFAGLLFFVRGPEYGGLVEDPLK